MAEFLYAICCVFVFLFVCKMYEKSYDVICFWAIDKIIREGTLQQNKILNKVLSKIN